MDYEQFKERIEEDLHQALADHGIDANFSQHHVEKLNASYDALSVTPEGSHIGVNANLSAMFEAIENGQDYNEVVSRASESPLRSYPRRCLPTARRIAHAGKTQAPARFSDRRSGPSAVCATSHNPAALCQCPWNAQLLQRKSPRCGSPSGR